MGLFSFLKKTGKKALNQVVDPTVDDFATDAQSLTAKEQQVNAGGRQNGVDRIIAADTTPDFQDQEEETPKKFGLLSGLKKAGKFVGDNAEMIMPAVYGLSQGVGVLPGLMYGLAAKNQRKATELELNKEAAEKQADLDWKKEMLKQQSVQKELDRENRLKVKTTPSATTLKEEEEFQTFLDAKQTIDELKAQKMTDEEIKKAYPDLSRIVYDYKQKKYYKRAAGDELSPDDPDYDPEL